MELRNIICIFCISLLLLGAVSAQKNANEFQIDKSFNSEYNGTGYSLYLNENHDSGITVYRNLVNDEDTGDYGKLIHDNGRDYLIPDDEMTVLKNSDDTANFTDYDNKEHGVVEVINVDGIDYVIVSWAKDGANVKDSDLLFQLIKFNKDNKVKPVAF